MNLYFKRFRKNRLVTRKLRIEEQQLVFRDKQEWGNLIDGVYKRVRRHTSELHEMTAKKGYYADCYVLSETWTSKFIFSFLDRFLPNRQEGADEYEIQQYSDMPKFVFKTAVELIDHLSINKDQVHTIYWSNTANTDIKGAMCYFTNTGQLILGLYCNTMYPDTTIEDKVLAELKYFCGNSNGYITYEEPVTLDMTEFLERVKSANN